MFLFYFRMRSRKEPQAGGALTSLLSGNSGSGTSGAHPAVAKITFSPGKIFEFRKKLQLS
jgi:hypothetical protein